MYIPTEEYCSIPLRPGPLSPERMVMPSVVALGGLVVIAGIVALVRPAGLALDMVLTIGLVLCALAFIILYRLMDQEQTLIIREEQVVLTDARRGELARVALVDLEVRHGYARVAARSVSGYVPVILIALGPKTLVFAASDAARYYYWAGDDLWEQRVSRDVDLPSSNLPLPGQLFETLARLTVPTDTLKSRPMGER